MKLNIAVNTYRSSRNSSNICQTKRLIPICNNNGNNNVDIILPTFVPIQKKILRSPVPMLEWQPPRTKVSCQMIHYDKSFKLICHIPIFQVIYKYSKNQADSKEDIEKASPNVSTAASTIKSYQLNHSPCKELPFDVLHAYLASNMRLFQESGSSKKKTLKSPVPIFAKPKG